MNHKLNNTHKALQDLISYLEKHEKSSFAKIKNLQHQALHRVVMHAEKFSPYIKKQLHQHTINIHQLSPNDYFKQLPILSRRDIQTAGEDLFCQDQTKYIEIQTSGSTGEPVKIRKANINNLFWLAHTFREHHWWQRDFSKRLAMIRADVPEKENIDWCSPLNILYKTGPSYTLPIDTDIEKQINWLKKYQPDYLLTYPSNLVEIIRSLELTNTNLRFIKGIRLIGETLHPDTREKAQDFFQTSVTDTYSSQEVGYIAMQCPDCHQYHVMAESLIVEVLNENDEQCQPGETGRVIVTELYNTITPIIRYEIGDYAIVGDPCSKRPGLPSLKHILGRERNMLILPDGKRFWPMLGYKQYRDIADIKQYQVVQTEKELIVMRLVVGTPLTEVQEKQLTSVLQNKMGYPFNVTFEYFNDKLPLSKNGKFEEFVRIVSD